MYPIDLSSIASSASDIKNLAKESEISSQTNFHFESFVNDNHNYVIAAVDGSNHNIKGNNCVFSTMRAGYLLYQYGKEIKSSIDPIKAEFMVNDDVKDIGFQYKHEYYFHSITGEIPSGQVEYDKVVERIRTLLEWDKVKYLIQTLHKGDIIIFDGSLISGEISTSHEFFSQLTDIAKSKGISLVGLSKDTSLSMGGIPIPLVLQKASRTQCPEQNWFVSIEDTHFVRFITQKEHIFRVDAVLPPGLEMKTLLSRIGAYCYDSISLGYPYPMQLIHNSVLIKENQRNYCFNLFKQQCRENQVSESTFNQLFSIYHQQLDKIAKGR